MPLLPPDFEATRAELRRRLRERRGSRSPASARDAAAACAGHVEASEAFRQAGHVAGYVAVDRELDPRPLLEKAHAAGKSVYLPRIEGKRGMRFVAWKPDDPLQPNRFGIPEPAAGSGASLEPASLDFVLVPLLGFDGRGNRLGFGGGFYDRAFAFRRERPAPPLLCGYAYADQRCMNLDAAEWDVPLDLAATEKGIESFCF